MRKSKEEDTQRITKTRPFINKYNLEGINFPSEKDYQKKFEKNKVTTALTVLYVKKEKHNSDHEK